MSVVDRSTVSRNCATEAAYLAGILDGEGCLRISRSAPRRDRKTPQSPRHAALVFVGNTSLPLVTHLRSTYGGSITRRRATTRHREFYVWQLTTKALMLEILRTARPYLLVKREQADLLIQFITEFRSFKGLHRVDPEELERRERIYQAVKALNHLSRGRLTTAADAAA